MKLKILKHSRRQIEEAIDFWTQILENKSPFLDKLVMEFGYDAVFREDIKMSFDFNDIERIAHMANNIIFDRAIANVRVLLDDQHRFTSTAVPFGYSYATYEDQQTGKCTLLTQPAYSDDGMVMFDAPAIYVSPDFLSSAKLRLVTVSSVVVHELIHQTIVETADSSYLAKLEQQINADHGHDDKFKKMMTDINAKFGLNVTVKGSMAYDDDAFRQLHDFAGDDYHIPESDNNVKSAAIVKYESGFAQVVLH